MGNETLAVQLAGIEKRFPGVIANHDVNLNVRARTIHAIVGENGAGKSTLMKTLYGMHQPEAGTISVFDQPITFRSPSDAIAAGIGMVHQHFMLADKAAEQMVAPLSIMSSVRMHRRPSTSPITSFASATLVVPFGRRL